MSQKRTGTRTETRSRGINFNTVSPSPAKITVSRRSETPKPYRGTQNDPTTPTPCKVPNNNSYESVQSSLNYNFELPDTSTLQRLDLNEQLRLLALKEMSVVEIKDSISRLKALLATSESDIRYLQRSIQGSLHKQFTPKPSTTTTPAKLGPDTDLTRQRTPSGSRRSRSRETEPGRNLTPHTQHKDTESWENQPDRQSKLWSNLAKPMSFISQLDNMISHEFEKSLGAGSPVRPQREKQDIELKTFRNKEPQSEGRNELEVSGRPHQNQHYPYFHGDTDDMFQAVSSSLWSFVNDVKTNMIATLNDGPTLYSLAESETEPSEKLISVPGTPTEDISSLSEDPSSSAPSESPELKDLDLSLRLDSDEEEPVDLSIYSSMRRNPS